MIQFNLPKTKRDWRNYSFHKTFKKEFGAFDLSQLPEEYILPSTILNQGASEKCTAYSACAIQESQHGISFDPDWFYDQEGVVNGSVNNYGYGLDVTMKTGIKVGFKPLSAITDPSLYKEYSYFQINGPYDLFDSIRSAIWLGKDNNKTAETGTMWYQEWTTKPKGIIDSVYSTPVGGHALKVAGWKTINNVLYLVMQNSWGQGYADNGFYYFPREVVNREFTYGKAFIWMVPNDPQTIKTQSWILSLTEQVIKLLSQWLKQ